MFPGNKVPWHQLFAMITFVSGGVTTVLSSRVVEGPFKYLSILFGGVSLFFLLSVVFLGDVNPLAFLELDGIE